MNEKELRFRVGLFVVAALVLLAILVMLFTGLPTLFKQFDRYTIVFTEASGVSEGTPVRRSGVRIGEVEKVELDEDTGKVRVTIIVDKKHTLHASDQATLVHGLLGGDTAIDFIPPKPNGKAPERTPIEPGTEMAGQPQSDVQTLVNQASDMMPETQETLKEMRETMKRFNQMAPRFDEALIAHRDAARAAREALPDLRKTNDEVLVAVRNWGRLGERADVLLQTNEEKLVKALDNFNETALRVSNLFSDTNQRNLSAAIKNVRAGTESLDSITRSTDELLKESRVTIRRVNESVGKADDVLSNLQKATKPMADRSASVMKNLDESTDKLNRTLTEVRELLRGLNQTDGTFQRLLNDPALYNNLNDAACMLARVIPRLDRVLKDVEVFADKIARHPEALGLGGIVSPSSGLKEAPSADAHWPR